MAFELVGTNIRVRNESHADPGEHEYLVELGLETAIQRPQDLIPKLADELDLPQAVRRRARTLAQRAVSAGLNNGCHPAGLAAATLYLGAQEHELSTTQADLADGADVSIVTLRASRDELLAVEH